MSTPSSTHLKPEAFPASVEGVRLAEFQSWLADLAGTDLSDAARLGLIASLEKLKGGAAAAQARLTGTSGWPRRSCASSPRR